MPNNYKIFFTIKFFCQIDAKKIISKSFKSDLDLNDSLLNCPLNDANIYKKWEEYALKTSLNNLNLPSNFNDNQVTERSIITHRIINLMHLTEVHKNQII